MDIIEGVKWRYNLYIKPYLLLDESLYSAVTRRFHNSIESRKDTPVCYVSADAGNAGDRVSAMGVGLLCNEPGIELYAGKAGIKETFWMLRKLEERKSRTKIIIGGGGLLQECFTPFWEQLLKLSTPFALFGVGANMLEKVRNLPHNFILDGIAHRATALHVRDKWTQQLLQRGQNRKVSVGICPSVNFLVDKFGISQENTKTHLFHIQHSVDIQMAGGDPKEISKIAKKIAQELGLQYDETDHIKENLESLVRRYQRARYVISSRLHGCIFSYALGVPFVAIACDKKITAFVESHAPDIPVMNIDFTMEECIQKLLISEKSMKKNKEILCLAIENNIKAMQNVLQSFEE